MHSVERCPICGSVERTPVCDCVDPRSPGARRFPVVRCSGCGTGYVASGPVDAELADYYPPDYAGYSAGRSRSSQVFLKILRTLRGDQVGSTLGVPILGPRTGERRALDVGIGGGGLALQMAHRGWSVYGIDFTRPGPSSAFRAEVQFVQARAGQPPFANASFDLIVASHVLEHLYDPLEALRSFRSILRPGGRLVIGVPNFDSFPSRLFHRATYDFLDVPRHLVFFTPSSLRRALNAMEFTQSVTDTIPSPALLPTLFQRLGPRGGQLTRGRLGAAVNGLSFPLDLATQTGESGCNITAIATRA
ncbi:MAG TPA: class I SAM-dependent methyltransferase [Thermoplasmata archaeon]|nr:class I SAM-dependent methyltransferase [Thermoplasmata archaeon]